MASYLFPSYASNQDCGSCAGSAKTCTPNVPAYSVISATGTFVVSTPNATNGTTTNVITLNDSYVNSTVVAVRVNLAPALGYAANDNNNVITKVYAYGYNVSNIPSGAYVSLGGSGSKTYISNVQITIVGIKNSANADLAGTFNAPVEIIVLNQKRYNQ
jgi:hypothetical protein